LHVVACHDAFEGRICQRGPQFTFCNASGLASTACRKHLIQQQQKSSERMESLSGVLWLTASAHSCARILPETPCHCCLLSLYSTSTRSITRKQLYRILLCIALFLSCVSKRTDEHQVAMAVRDSRSCILPSSLELQSSMPNVWASHFYDVPVVKLA
jgi:hypothetical protein